MLAGLPGAGKTTVARDIAEAGRAVRFTLDEWMLRLYGMSYDDPQYGECAALCRDLIWDTAQQVLEAGVDVVFDWSQWSRMKRAEWVERAAKAGYALTLHYVATPLEVAVERAERRHSEFAHPIDEAAVAHMARLFEEPTADEGFHLCLHDI